MTSKTGLPLGQYIFPGTRMDNHFVFVLWTQKKTDKRNKHKTAYGKNYPILYDPAKEEIFHRWQTWCDWLLERFMTISIDNAIGDCVCALRC